MDMYLIQEIHLVMSKRRSFVQALIHKYYQTCNKWRECNVSVLYAFIYSDHSNTHVMKIFKYRTWLIDGNRGVKRCNTLLAYSMIHTKNILVYIGKSVLKLLAFGHFIYVS